MQGAIIAYLIVYLTLFSITPESLRYMVAHIERINDLIKKLDSLKPLSPSAQKDLDKKFRLEFNYNSNHMEGNTLSYLETILVLQNDLLPQNHTLSEVNEMNAHDGVFSLIIDWSKDHKRMLTEHDIKELHKLLLIKPYYKDAQTPDGNPARKRIEVGQYKTQPNHVRQINGDVFEYATPIDTPIEMGKLMDWYRHEAEIRTTPVIVIAALFHYRFVRIHPFDDGNGRMSRLLMNYILLQNDYPPVVIKSAEKINYLTALKSADNGDLEAFLTYIEENLIWSIELSIKAARGEEIEEESDLDKSIAILNRRLTNTEVHKTRNSAVVKDLWNDSLKELSTEFLTTTNKFKGLFNKNKLTLYVQVGDFVNTFESIDELEVFLLSSDEDPEVIQIGLENSYIDLKSTSFNAKMMLTITLNRSRYSINPFTAYPVDFNYLSVLTNTESKSLIKSMADMLLEQINDNVRATQV